MSTPGVALEDAESLARLFRAGESFVQRADGDVKLSVDYEGFAPAAPKRTAFQAKGPS